MRSKGEIALVMMLVAAHVVHGLTNGPVQPEYMRFSSLETDKLVDLPTGGFTYDIPLGEVKSGSGPAYPIVLNYQAGIAAEQEATWCGLGWSLNVGSINRKVVGCPDDYAGENYTKYTHDNGDRGTDYFFTVGYTNYGSSSTTFGWRESDETGTTFLGITSLSCNWFGFTVDWHPPSRDGSDWGYSYSMSSIPLGMGNSPTYHHEGGMEPESYWSQTYGVYVYNYRTGASGGGGVTLDSRGGIGLSGSVDGYGGSFGLGHQDMSKRGVQTESKSYSLGGSVSLGDWGGSLGLSFGWTKWRWKYDQMTAGRTWGYLFQSPRSPMESPVLTENPLLAMVLEETGPWQFATPGGPGEDLYGKGGALYTRHAADKLEYIGSDSLSFPSQDIYNVRGQGLTGSFKPFVHRAMTVHASYTDLYDGLMGRMESRNATTISEFYNYGGDDDTLRISQKYTDGIVFRMLSEASLNFIDSLENCTYTDSYAKGLYDWNSFQCIDTCDYRAGATRIDPIFGLDADLPDKLCGFVVTDKQGKTYWYTEPIFSLQDASYISKENRQPTPANKHDCTLREDFGSSARTWLLTAVTGPAYVKRSMGVEVDEAGIRSVDDIAFKERLMPHDGDWGYWVRFRYSYGAAVTDEGSGMPRIDPAKADIEIPKGTYAWRHPYSDTYHPNVHKRTECIYANEDQPRWESSYGLREVTYLKSIETQSHVAFFRTSPRLDGFGIDYATEYPDLSSAYALSTSQLEDLRDRNLRDEWLATEHRMTVSGLGTPYEIVTSPPSLVKLPESGNVPIEDCYRIRVDDQGFDVDWYERLPSGTRFAIVQYRADAMYNWVPGSGGTMSYLYAARGVKDTGRIGELCVIKDTAGWRFNDDSTAFVFSGSLPDEYALGSTLEAVRGRLKAGDPFGTGHIRNSRHTKYARCLGARRLPDGQGTEYYVVGYNGKLRSTDNPLITGQFFVRGLHKNIQPGGMYAVMDYKSINIVSARITDEVWRRYEDRNPMVRYVKKLDEIAWYSKLRYPTLDGKWDPGVNVENLAYLQQNNGYPESYRRVKFRYSYELAQGTPNSKSGTVTYSAGRIDGYEGGRLTLKEVREEGGPETAPVSLPPYLFTYQGQDIRYEWDNDDEWGYTKTGEHYMAPDYGVCWNLSEILLPACATIKVDLERDEIHSSLATLARMRRDFPCAHHTGDGSVYGFYPEPTPGAFYVQSGISNPAAHDGSATLSLESTAGLAPGMFCFVVAFVVPSGNELLSHYEHYYTYVIEDVDHVAGTVTLNQDVGENGHVWDHAKLYAIKESRLRCDGVRVSQVTVAPLYGDERVTSFTYPEGGDIRGLPPEAVPQLFVLEAQRYEAEDDEVLAKEGSKVEDNHYIVSNRAPFSGTGYRRWHSENQSALEWPNVYAPYNHVPYLLYIRYRVQGDETPRRDISVQGYAYEEDYVEFPINGNQWSMKCLAFEVGKYGRKKPEKSPGVKVHLNCRNREHMLEIDYIQVYPREGMTLVRSRPLELGIYDPHLFSGRRVIYPYVEVTQEPSGMVGKIRHRFYTYDDSVTLSPEGLGEIKMPVMHRVRSQTAEGLPLEQIIDHSAIVGAAKSIEFIDTSGEIVYTSKPTYRFSEDLNDHEGALFASLDNRLPADKPVGLVRERTVRMQHRIAEEPEDAEDQQDEDIWFVRRGVTDMIRSSLFMVREDKTYDRNGVTVSVRKGLFDAYRGAAMAELRTNYDSDGQKHGLLSIEAPTTYVETGNRLTGLKKKNIYTHSAFTMSAQPATVGFPLTIQEVIAQQNETGYSVLQAGATGWSVEPFDSSAEVPYDQWRYYKDTSYVWGGAPTFASRDLMPEQWIARSRVQSIDQLSRPRTVVDAHGVPATFVTHPFRADPAAIADNAGYEETAVFTCDYDDYQRGEPSPDGTYLLDAPYFDLSNGWEKGETNLLHLLVPPTCEVSTDMPHFGDATLFIENARGPLATRRVRPGKTYQMSAWVKVVEGTLIMSADYRVSNRTEGEEEWPYTDSSHLVNAAGEPATVVRYVEAGDDWQYVEMEVPTEGLDPNEKWFVRISLGNGKGDINSDDGHVTAYVDDIRFHPSDALVRTYRYDRNMGLLIAVVDANNQADYFEYDPFGRLTGKGRYTSTQ